MNLLVFAHRGEAKTFLSELNFKSVKGKDFLNLYKNDSNYLLICGEGLQSATELTASVLSFIHEEVRNVINFGIAGALDKSLELNNIYSVQTIYSEKITGAMQFKSFSSSDPKAYFDCVSAIDRVLNDENSIYLSKFAQIVDRELWAIASVAKLFKKPFQSFKLISDYAGTDTSCFDISNKTDFYSQHLFDYFSEHFDSKEQLKEEDTLETPDGFYFTTAQKRSYKNLYEKLSKKLSLNENELFDYLKINEIIKQDIQAKLKTKFLIEKMQNALSPYELELNKNLKEIFKPFQHNSVQVQIQKDLETENFSVHADIKNENEFEKLKSAVNHFNYKEYIDFLNGKK
jgi:nucleoside phosphorylase